MIKSKYISDILELLLDGDKEGLFARQQIPFVLDTKYSYTGGGLFVSFEHLQGIELFKVDIDDLVLNGVKIENHWYPLEAEAILFFKNGLIDYLEIWCYDGDYPNYDLLDYTLTQFWDTSTKKSITLKGTTLLYRPVNQDELDLIMKSNWTRFPPRLPEQPIFYPVTNEEYAIQIAKEWNVPAYGVGFVTRFSVRTDYLDKFNIENVGGEVHNEYWIPAEELDNFNDNIVGQIEVTKEFRKL